MRFHHSLPTTLTSSLSVTKKSFFGLSHLARKPGNQVSKAVSCAGNWGGSSTAVRSEDREALDYEITLLS